MYGFTPTKSGTFYISSDSDAEDKKNGITQSFSTMKMSQAGPKVSSPGVLIFSVGMQDSCYIKMKGSPDGRQDRHGEDHDLQRDRAPK